MKFHTKSLLLMATVAGSLFMASAQAAQSNLTTCEAFLKRTCSTSEQAGFDRGFKSVRSKQMLTASNCDSFLGRTCSSNEQQYYQRGMRAHVVKDQLACNCDSFLHRSCSRTEALSYSQGVAGRTDVASNCKLSGSTLALNQ